MHISYKAYENTVRLKSNRKLLALILNNCLINLKIIEKSFYKSAKLFFSLITYIYFVLLVC